MCICVHVRVRGRGKLIYWPLPNLDHLAGQWIIWKQYILDNISTSNNNFLSFSLNYSDLLLILDISLTYNPSRLICKYIVFSINFYLFHLRKLVTRRKKEKKKKKRTKKKKIIYWLVNRQTQIAYISAQSEKNPQIFLWIVLFYQFRRRLMIAKLFVIAVIALFVLNTLRLTGDSLA